MPSFNKNSNLNMNLSEQVRVFTNDNSLIVEGPTADGYRSESILFNDPDFATKARAGVKERLQEQAARLDEFYQQAQDNQSKQAVELQDELEKFINAIA